MYIQGVSVDPTRTKEIRAWKNATIAAATKKWLVTLVRIPEGGWYFAEARYEGQTTGSGPFPQRPMALPRALLQLINFEPK